MSGVMSQIFMFLVIWWLTLFVVLPWGIRRQESPDAGHDPGAPSNPMLLAQSPDHDRHRPGDLGGGLSHLPCLRLFLPATGRRDRSLRGGKMSGYCRVAPGHEFHGPYHAHHYGFPIADDDQLFERLVLEINQAGLSWLTILKSRNRFRAAYSDFSIAKVARYGDKQRERLLNDAGIIRNKLEGQCRNRERQKDPGAAEEPRLPSRPGLRAHHPLTKAEWVKLFKKQFVFTGGEIVGEFLMSIGYLPGTHAEDCPVYKKIAAADRLGCWRPEGHEVIQRHEVFCHSR